MASNDILISIGVNVRDAIQNLDIFESSWTDLGDKMLATQVVAGIVVDTVRFLNEAAMEGAEILGGEYAEAFGEMADRQDEATQAGKTWLAEVLFPTIRGVNDLISARDSLRNALNQGKISQSEYNQAMRVSQLHGLASAEATAIYEQTLEKANGETEEAVSLLVELGLAYRFSSEEAESFDRVLKGLPLSDVNADLITQEMLAAEAAEAAENYARGLNAMNRSSRDIISNRQELIGTMDDFATKYAALGDGRSSPIAGFIDDLQFLMSGGAEIAGVFQQFQQALEDGVDPSSLMEGMGDLLVSSLLAEMEAGTTDLDTAKQTLVDTLGVTDTEAGEMLSEFETAIDALTEAERELNVAILKDDRDEVLDQLERLFPSGLSSRSYTVDIEFNVTGAEGLPGGTGGFGSSGGGGTKGTAGQKALGGPVSAGVPYMVGEFGPERFVPNQDGTIIPTQNVNVAPPQVIVMLDSEQIAANVMIKSGEQARITNSSGGMYVG